MPCDTLPLGIHPGIGEAVYHRDPTEGISASASILRTLYKKSPAHAAHAHPKLRRNHLAPSAARRPTDDMIRGTILHHLMLGTPAPHLILPYSDYRSKSAQEARALAHFEGRVPILEDEMELLYLVAEDLRAKLERDFPDISAALNDAGTMREATLIWRERDVLCRSRVDFLPPARYGFLGDLKFTGIGAAPDEWSVRMHREYLFQAALYPRGVRALRGDAPEFRFVVVEWAPPYGVSVHALGRALIQIADRQLNVALDRWKRCLSAGSWPGYPSLIHYAEAPGRMLSEEDSLIVRDAAVDQWGERHGEGSA